MSTMDMTATTPEHDMSTMDVTGTTPEHDMSTMDVTGTTPEHDMSTMDGSTGAHDHGVASEPAHDHGTAGGGHDDGKVMATPAKRTRTVVLMGFVALNAAIVCGAALAGARNPRRLRKLA